MHVLPFRGSGRPGMRIAVKLLLLHLHKVIKHWLIPYFYYYRSGLTTFFSNGFQQLTLLWLFSLCLYCREIQSGWEGTGTSFTALSLGTHMYLSWEKDSANLSLYLSISVMDTALLGLDSGHNSFLLSVGEHLQYHSSSPDSILHMLEFSPACEIIAQLPSKSAYGCSSWIWSTR